MAEDRNCISYWHPRLSAAGVPQPATWLVKADLDFHGLLDEPPRTPAGWDRFVAALAGACRSAAGVSGWPVFLRTGQGRGKHRWKHTCLLTNPDDLPRHVRALVEWSAEADFMGLPTDVWAAREMLPTDAEAVLDAYGDMPLVPEARFFVAGGKVLCGHHYWPGEAVCQGFRVEPDGLCGIIAQARSLMTDRWREAEALALRVARAFDGDGAWSVDVLPTRSGLYVTDMAEAARSFHWRGCPAAAGLSRPGGVRP